MINFNIEHESISCLIFSKILEFVQKANNCFLIFMLLK